MSSLQDLKDALVAAENSVIAAQVAANSIQDPLNQLIVLASTPDAPVDYSEEVQKANAIQSRAVTLTEFCNQLAATINGALPH